VLEDYHLVDETEISAGVALLGNRIAERGQVTLRPIELNL
jgi:hypothetical protein